MGFKMILYNNKAECLYAIDWFNVKWSGQDKYSATSRPVLCVGHAPLGAIACTNYGGRYCRYWRYSSHIKWVRG